MIKENERGNFMKKAIVWLNALLPVMYLMMIGICILINPNDEMLFFILGIYSLIGLLLPGLLALLTANTSNRLLATGNLWIAISNLSLLAAQAIYWFTRLIEIQIAAANGAMEGGLELVVLILLYLPHWVSYFLARIACAINCVRVLLHKSNNANYILYALMHLLPITDLIGAMLVLRQVKKQEN